jgi:ABC-type branched-subunit amino acid transport system ATPase component
MAETDDRVSMRLPRVVACHAQTLPREDSRQFRCIAIAGPNGAGKTNFARQLPTHANGW